MTTAQIITIVAVVLILGIIIFPKGLVYFKNVSNGSTGVLFYVKNKRKILALPWVLDGGNMLCTKENPFSNWDYPEEKQPINEDELKQLSEELEKYNKKSPVKIVFK